MQDQELFDLCKAVYEKTGWDTNPYTEGMNRNSHPFYTSDYILEKLPKDTGLFKTILSQEEYRYFANSEKQIGGAYADTPIKALLKLTVALIEAGQLDNITKEVI